MEQHQFYNVLLVWNDVNHLCYKMILIKCRYSLNLCHVYLSEPDLIVLNMFTGETLGYFNLTDLLRSDGKLTAAQHKPSDTVRAAAVSNKFKVLTIILYPNRNATDLEFFLQGQRGSEPVKFQVRECMSFGVQRKKLLAFALCRYLKSKVKTSS